MAYECCKHQFLCEDRSPLQVNPNQNKATCKEKFPPLGNVYAPWVCLKFKDANSRTLTVGNLSNPPDNKAVIKSFEYTSANGRSTKFVIEDQQGGELTKFVDHLNTDWMNAASDRRRVMFQFGWVKQGCSMPLPGIVSPCYVNLVNTCDVSYSGGKFTIELNCSDTMTLSMTGHDDQHYGSESHPVFLRDAIKNLLTRGAPPHIKYLSILNNKGQRGLFKGEKWNEKKQIYENSPKGVYLCESEDKLSIIRRWIFDYISENNLGWAAEWADEATKDGIIIREDMSDTSKSVVESSDCLASYVVNGGNTSPVLEFSPKFNWSFDTQISSQAGTDSQSVSPNPNVNQGNKENNDGGNTHSVKTGGRTDIQELSRASQPGAGGTTNSAPPDNIVNTDGRQAANIVAKNNSKNILAESRLWPNKLEANLVVIGDPCLLSKPWLSAGRKIAIKMVNPFFINKQNSPFNPDTSYEWLASPKYNATVENTTWWITSINHRIEAGNYTTTLNLQTMAPGSDAKPGKL